jgi:hypothetical protein
MPSSVHTLRPPNPNAPRANGQGSQVPTMVTRPKDTAAWAHQSLAGCCTPTVVNLRGPPNSDPPDAMSQHQQKHSPTGVPGRALGQASPRETCRWLATSTQVQAWGEIFLVPNGNALPIGNDAPIPPPPFPSPHFPFPP